MCNCVCVCQSSAVSECVMSHQPTTHLLSVCVCVFCPPVSPSENPTIHIWSLYADIQLLAGKPPPYLTDLKRWNCGNSLRGPEGGKGSGRGRRWGEKQWWGTDSNEMASHLEERDNPYFKLPVFYTIYCRWVSKTTLLSKPWRKRSSHADSNPTMT